MTTIEQVTLIEAPIEKCFSLSLSIDLELDAAKDFHLRAVGGVTSGQIGAGQRVRWATTQFGITVSHESEITVYRPPESFQDSMIHGLFRSFQHDHFFRPVSAERTEMRDLLRFEMPKLLLGRISERLLVKARLLKLLQLRNSLIKTRAPLR